MAYEEAGKRLQEFQERSQRQHEERMKVLRDRADRVLQDSHDRAVRAWKGGRS